MSLFSKLGNIVKAVAPIASVIPGPWQPIAMGVTAVSAASQAARSAQGSTISAAPVMPGVGPMMPQTFAPMVQQAALPGLPALGGMAARALPAIGAAAGRAVSMGRGLIGAANRWCARNPKTCGALGGASVVAEMMRTGEIKRPGRRMNPMNVRAMRRAIRRVKAGRKIARQIESLLPHRSSRGVMHATPSRIIHAGRR